MSSNIPRSCMVRKAFKQWRSAASNARIVSRSVRVRVPEDGVQNAIVDAYVNRSSRTCCRVALQRRFEQPPGSIYQGKMEAERFETAHEIVEAALRRLGRTKKRFAGAIGRIRPEHLTPARMRKAEESWIHRDLLWELRGVNRPRVAADLELDIAQHQTLMQLYSDLHNVYEGGRVEWTEESKAVEWGQAGRILFDRSKWRLAAPFLTRSWKSLLSRKPRFNVSEEHNALLTLLIAGPQLASILIYLDKIEAAAAIVRSLAPYTETEAVSDPELLDALGRAEKAAAVVLQRTRAVPPLALERHARRSCELLSVSGLPPGPLIGAQRDWAKACAARACGWAGMAGSPRHAAEMQVHLNESRRLAGGDGPREGLEDEWLFTELTAVSCSALLGCREDALRSWEHLMANQWVHQILEAYARTPLPAKFRFTEMSLAAAGGNFDRAAAAARAFQVDPRSTGFPERRRRAAELERWATSYGRTSTLGSVLF